MGQNHKLRLIPMLIWTTIILALTTFKAFSQPLMPDNPIPQGQAKAQGILVAVIDSGIDYNHAFLANHISVKNAEVLDNQDNDKNGFVDDYMGWDFKRNDKSPYDLLTLQVGVPQAQAASEYPSEDAENLVTFLSGGHGTHVSGIILDIANNEPRLLPLRVGMSIDQVIDAINYAANAGAKIINLSLGGYDYELLNQDVVNLRAAIAAHPDVVFVCAAGNDNKNMVVDGKLFPASFNLDNIISVGALNGQDEIASFSNVGMGLVDIYAPGVDIWSAWPGPAGANQLEKKSGTSMAAPFVSGAIAKLLKKQPGLQNRPANVIIQNLKNIGQRKLLQYQNLRVGQGFPFQGLILKEAHVQNL